MPSLSLIIPAPHGYAQCLPLEQLEGPTKDLEIVVVAGVSEAAPTGKLAGVKHLVLPGAGVFTLRRAGIAAATGDWLVVTEEHCRLLPGCLDAYREAIQENPEAELFSGAVVNHSAPHAMANFIFGHYAHLPALPVAPTWALIANAAVRRSAILEAELAEDGGFELLTLPRLAAAGRHAHCARAGVDHVVDWGLLRCCLAHFHNGRTCAAFRHRLHDASTLERARWTLDHSWRLFSGRQRAVLRNARHVHPHPWSLVPELTALAASHAAGTLLGSLAGPGDSPLKID